MPVENTETLLEHQYKTAVKLSARIDLHTRFSTNPYGWFRWLFEQIALPPQVRILELACGRGDLWLENLDRIPSGWEITLSDFSKGMLAETKARLKGTSHPFRFHLADIRSIPAEDDQFDAVIANHMLYYVPEKMHAFREVLRVLAPGGTFFATSVGRTHLKELTELVHDFDQSGDLRRSDHELDFTLEDGAAQLEACFAQVELRRYEDSLEITESEPLVAYLRSGMHAEILEPHLEAFRAFVTRKIQSQGAIHIFKDSGLFIARQLEGTR
ncbi:MAG: class I SAM-dependent methyltransferase [Anaerolineales bacterium]|nr:class I SAM-dependent methyltransferase [Anaerolineales bacterium]